jgi:hypothetical protein
MSLAANVPALGAGPTACVVNAVTDEHNAGSGTCDSTAAGMVTLRSAIESFNTSGNTGTITFNLPAPSVITETNGELSITNGDVTITGPGARLLAVDGDAKDRVFHVGVHGTPLAATAKIVGMTIRNGLTKSLSVYPGYAGGGIFNDGGILTMDQVTITGNHSSYGGGIDQEGRLTLTNSTVSNNLITDGGNGCGGSAMEYEADVTNSFTTFTDVTVSGNDSGTCTAGTFWDSLHGGAETFTNMTMSGNTGSGGGFTGSATISNSILANQTGGPVCSDHPTDGGSNLDSGTTCGFVAGTPTFGLPSTDPALDVLANNGGPTDTMRLKAGSPAIDAVHNACPPPTADQRGVTRPRGSACDIGAFELLSPLAVGTAAASCGAAAGGGAVTINGSGFLDATAVTFGGKAAQGFTVISDIQINAVAPAGAAGQTVGIVVTTTAGSSAGTPMPCVYAAGLPAAGAGPAAPVPSGLLPLLVTAATILALGGLAVLRRRLG